MPSMFNILHRILRRRPIVAHREPTATPKGSDSHPSMFRGVALEQLMKQRDKWLSYYSPLDDLNVDNIRTCYNESLQGAYARQQWLWEQLELVDPTMAVCLRNRESGLKKYRWDVVIRADVDDAEMPLAEAQQRTAMDLLQSIRNMPEAIQALSMASRRHYKFLQPYEDSTGLHLLPIDNWRLCRDGYPGPWGYNPRADFGRSKGEELAVPVDQLVMRICPHPICMAAQMSALGGKATLAQWDIFLGRYGTPPIFLVLPEGISQEDYQQYIKAAEQCVSNAAGVLPGGSDLKSPTVPATSVELFDRRLKTARDEIRELYTGSILTMTTAPDSGSLAGGAHQDTSDTVVAGEADDIAVVLTEQIIDRILAQYHPGQPRLVEVVMRIEQASDPMDEINVVTALRQAGYDLDDQEISERTGWTVTKGLRTPTIYETKAAGYVPTQSAIQDLLGMPVQPAPIEEGDPYTLTHRIDSLQRSLVLHRSSTLYIPAREVLERRTGDAIDETNRRLTAVTHRIARREAPLTEEELSAIRQGLDAPVDLSGTPRLARSIQTAFKAAIPSVAINDPQNP